MHETLDCYFDRYQRFRAAAAALDRLADGRSLTVLDVGGFDDAFAAFAPHHRITPYAGIIAPEAPAEPADGAFDAVVALDVLEHVPPKHRGFFLAELARVAGVGVVLAHPVAAARAAEEFVLLMTGSAWLAEHRQYGLPDPAEVEAELAALNLAVESEPNACLPSWTAMMLLMHGTEAPVRKKISRFFNERFFDLENREPAYRRIFVCRKRGETG